MAAIGQYYAILGVPRGADQQTIKQAYHELAWRYHPDRSTEPDAEERFAEIAEAYAVLSEHAGRAGDSERGDRAGDDDSGSASGVGWFGRLFGEPNWRE